MKRRIITERLFRRLGARPECPDLKCFTKEWPDGTAVTRAACLRAVELRLSFAYAARLLLDDPAREEYSRKTAAAWEECYKTETAAWRECHRKTPPGWEEYSRKTAAAWREYHRKQALVFWRAHLDMERKRNE